MTSASAINVTPFDTALGADISCVNLATIDKEGLAVVIQALEDYFVLRLRAQTLTDPDLIRFGRMFGELDPPGPNPYGEPIHPTHPELNIISNLKTEDGTPMGNLGYGEAVWHQDLTYIDIPPKCSVLYGV